MARDSFPDHWDCFLRTLCKPVALLPARQPRRHCNPGRRRRLCGGFIA